MVVKSEDPTSNINDLNTSNSKNTKYKYYRLYDAIKEDIEINDGMKNHPQYWCRAFDPITGIVG